MIYMWIEKTGQGRKEERMEGQRDRRIKRKIKREKRKRRNKRMRRRKEEKRREGQSLVLWFSEGSRPLNLCSENSVTFTLLTSSFL